MKFACIGEAMIELSTGGAHPLVGVAGDTLNTAVYLKRNAPDFEVDYITRLGSDPFSAQIRDFIDAQGVGTAGIETSEDRIPGLYAITTSGDGERSFTYWRGQAAAREMFQRGGGTDFSVLERYDGLYLSGISLAILPYAVRMALLEYLRGSKQIVAFDSNYRPRLWESETAAREVMAAYWARADIALPSLDDEMALFGETEAQVVARFGGYNGIGALKRGDAGPLSLGEAVGVRQYPAAKQVVDTTAAGDSFNGAYLAAKLAGRAQVEALAAGHACAAHVVQHRGAIVAG